MEDRSLAEMPVVPQGLLRAAYDQAHRTRDYRCRHHPEILLRRGDSDAERRAYAIDTNMIKAGTVDGTRVRADGRDQRIDQQRGL